MTDRVTRDDLERIAATVSESLPENLKVFVQARNGYYGLDLYVLELNEADGPRAAMIDTLHTGSKRELYTYLQGMRRTFLLQSPSYRYAA